MREHSIGKGGKEPGGCAAWAGGPGCLQRWSSQLRVVGKGLLTKPVVQISGEQKYPLWTLLG